MIKTIKIITDSSSDLSKDIVSRYNIEVVPTSIYFGDDVYDAEVLEKAEFYKMIEETSVIPKTSSPSPERFMKSYESVKEDNLLVINVTSKLSDTYSNAVIAKNIFKEKYPNKNIRVIDTGTGSVGEGLLVVKAAQLLEEGKGFDEVVNTIESIKINIEFYGLLDSLENSIKGGRIDHFVDEIINESNLKIIIKVNNGDIELCDKVIGEDDSVEKLVEFIYTSIKDKEFKTLAIGHANCKDKALKVKEMILKNYSFENVTISEIGASMGSYTAKGAILISVL